MAIESTIRVDVDYYDGAHKRLLSSYPNADAIAASVATGINVPTAEFYTYFLFHRKHGNRGRHTYRSLAEQAYKAKTWLDGEIDLRSGSLARDADSRRLPNQIIEHVGEAVGLSVVNRLYGLRKL